MKHIVIGTAGHIDHGKTTLIKALTGKETDTLKEEKERGISIDLGFTFFDLPSGGRAGIIDVPGHERFIKNMLAGVSSIDVVLLVIAADEGIMPQTKEHMEILQLLNVKRGIIVLTKCDLVDDEWLSMIREDIKEKFRGTFLQNASIFNVSSKTENGLEALVNAIDSATEEVESKETEGHFRLPVDRAFSISGFGTVVTGTIIGGRVKVGESVQLYPSELQTKVRNIQVHETNVSFAEAGQRCALNLANVKVEDIKRGNVVSKEEVMKISSMIDCKLYYLKGTDKPLKNRQRVRLYHGTNEILCRVVILDKEEIKPGESAYVQLRLEEPLAAQRSDRFVIRSYSPMHTIGGGIIIEPAAAKAKVFDSNYIEQLKIKESGKNENILENAVEKLSENYPNAFEILKALGKNDESIEDNLEILIKERRIIKLTSVDKAIYVHVNYLKQKISEVEKVLTAFHKENPLKIGMSKEEIKSKIFGKGIKQKIYDELLQELQDREVIKITNNFIASSQFNIKHTKEQEKLIDHILDQYNKAKYSSPKYEEVASIEKDKRRFKMVYDYLLDAGKIVKLSEDCILLDKHYLEAKELIRRHIEEKESITAAEARDLLNTSRKYIISILEHFDRIKFTKRLEDKRVLL